MKKKKKSCRAQQPTSQRQDVKRKAEAVPFPAFLPPLTLEGGSVSSYQTWLQRYNAINCGLQAVRDAYMPQGSRKQQYLAIYKDILQKTVEVCDYISYLRKLKEVKKQPNSAPAPRHSHIYTVCRAAHGRWKVAMAAGSGVGE